MEDGLTVFCGLCVIHWLFNQTITQVTLTLLPSMLTSILEALPLSHSGMNVPVYLGSPEGGRE